MRSRDDRWRGGIVLCCWRPRIAHLQSEYLLRTNLQDILKPSEYKVMTAATSVVLAAVCVAVGVGGGYLLQKVLMVALGALLKLPATIAQNIIFLIALVNGGLLAALIGYLVGMPLLRLSSDYFGIATLGFSIMVYTALQNSDAVIPTMKGARGMVEIPCGPLGLGCSAC